MYIIFQFEEDWCPIGLILTGGSCNNAQDRCWYNKFTLCPTQAPRYIKNNQTALNPPRGKHL
jgi:hypothetical protein